MHIPRKLGRIPENPEEGYLPFRIALAEDILDPDEVVLHDPREAALKVMNGRMPDQGGLLDLNDGVGAIDLVSAEVRGSSLTLGPLSKEAVDDKTDGILEVGALTLTFPNGLLKLFGFSNPPELRPWTEVTSPFDLADVIMLGVEARVFEIRSIAGGTIHATTPNRVF